MCIKLKLLILILFAVTELSAGPGKVVVKGTAEKVFIYNSYRGKERKMFSLKEEGKTPAIILPEEQCNDLLYIIGKNGISWIRVKPDDVVVIDMGKQAWKFSGDQAAVNRYLNEWTQKMYFGKPNMLTERVQSMMMSQVPAEYEQKVDISLFYTPEYAEWVNGLQPQLLADLERARLKDSDFVKEQRERIGYACLELQLQNYRFAQWKGEVPANAADFAKDITFDSPGFINYPGCDDMLQIYFDIYNTNGWLTYDSQNFLAVSADRLGNQQIKEKYILDELDNILRNKWLYQTDLVMGGVADRIVTPEGKQRLNKYQAEYQKLANGDEAGKQAFRFEFENKDGETVRLGDFKGKYLFIDIWATWCGPCKYQIPYVLKLEKELNDENIAFLSISVDKPGDKAKWLATLKDFGLEENCVISPNAFDYEMFKKYQVSSIPRFMLIDPNGKMVMTKARRPSDPVLKLQLTDLLSRYATAKSVISGTAAEHENESFALLRKGGMTAILDQKSVKNGSFSLGTVVSKPELLGLSMGRKFSTDIWVRPGARIDVSLGRQPIFKGDDAAINNFIIDTRTKYASRYPKQGATEILDRKRSETWVGIYNEIVADIEATTLPQEEKRLLKGYFQGELLSNLYNRIYLSKVFGKSYPKPVVKKGYSDPVLHLDVVPEIANCSNWSDAVQELLYARLEAGKIKIGNSTTYLTDLAKGFSNPEMQEIYVMDALRMEILRGQLVGVKERLEHIRPLIKNLQNQKILDEMPGQIQKAEERYKMTLPGTDLSAHSFTNQTGQIVSLGDFKGKYVFIDLWSTGCNPCVGEIPYIKEMEHRFAGTPIVWVSISLDLKEKEWKDFMVKNNMKGVQLLAEKGFKHPFFQQIGLGGIPHFLLLDKEGKVVDYNTLRPSNPVLGELLNTLLR